MNMPLFSAFRSACLSGALFLALQGPAQAATYLLTFDATADTCGGTCVAISSRIPADFGSQIANGFAVSYVDYGQPRNTPNQQLAWATGRSDGFLGDLSGAAFAPSGGMIAIGTDSAHLVSNIKFDFWSPNTTVSVSWGDGPIVQGPSTLGTVSGLISPPSHVSFSALTGTPHRYVLIDFGRTASAIDNVQFDITPVTSPVPEAPEAAMLSAGLLLIALTARRRRMPESALR